MVGNVRILALDFRSNPMYVASIFVLSKGDTIQDDPEPAFPAIGAALMSLSTVIAAVNAQLIRLIK
jgi:hypothetical protein